MAIFRDRQLRRSLNENVIADVLFLPKNGAVRVRIRTKPEFVPSALGSLHVELHLEAGQDVSGVLHWIPPNAPPGLWHEYVFIPDPVEPDPDKPSRFLPLIVFYRQSGLYRSNIDWIVFDPLGYSIKRENQYSFGRFPLEG